MIILNYVIYTYSKYILLNIVIVNHVIYDILNNLKIHNLAMFQMIYEL